MPRRSSARTVAYDLRPAKQSERRLIIDILHVASDCGLPVRDYRYVGMGANRFYDFILFHKYLGISSMVSLERDPKMFKRSQFNVPFGFVDVQQSNVDAFLRSDKSEMSTIYWLDYDGGIGRDLVSDISILMNKLKLGDIFFITANGQPPHVLDTESDEVRLSWLNDEIGPTAGDVEIADVENVSFWRAVHKIMIAASLSGLAQRTEAKFLPLLQVRYSDGAEMVTIGGSFLDKGEYSLYEESLQKTLPFLLNKDPVYRIASLNFTERERALFDLAVTKSVGSTEEKKLRQLGFTTSEIAAYAELMRYLPRYVETQI